MKKQHLIPCLTSLSILLIHSIAHAGTFTAFGPNAFTRGSGKPVVETASFSIPNPSTAYTLRVYNGGINSEYAKVSSATVKLNGSTISDTKDFTQQVSYFQKQVNVSTGNQLQVELRSAPESGLTVLIEGEDDTLPTIAVNIPANGTYLNTPSITVTGTASDSISWIEKVTVDGTNATLTGEVYTSSVRLTEGPNTITGIATDAAGNTGNASATVILDTIPPKITLDPVPSLTNKPPLTITGKIEDASPVTSLTVSGSPATISNNAFTATVNLAEGSNNIVVVATDKAGNTSSSAVIVNLDTAAPVINITSPTNSSTVNTSAVIVTGTIDDNSATVTVNGIAATFSNNTFTASNITLTEGVNSITVTAGDAAGNASTASISVTRISDTTPPVIAITYPLSGGILNTSPITVTGTIDDAAARVTVNGYSATVHYDERIRSNLFTGSMTLSEGENTIIVVATDQVGNSARDVVTVRYSSDITPPTVIITSPADGSTVSTNTVDVTGRIDDNTATVAVNGIPATVSNYALTATGIRLVEGANTITVTATDPAGNISRSSIAVNYSAASSINVAISDPRDGSNLTSASVYIYGTISSSTALTPIAYVSVNDRMWGKTPLTSSGPDTWFFKDTLSLPLQPGKNTITVTAWDTARNTATTTITVYYLAADNTPPVITITSPADGSYVSYAKGYVNIAGMLSEMAKISINGIDYGYYVSNFYVTVNNLTEGENTITLTAADQAGNKSSASVKVICETRPTVFTATAPTSDANINNTVVSYTLSKAIDYGHITITWTGGNPDPNSPYEFDFAVPDITAGTHAINTGLKLADGAIYTVSFDGTGTDGYEYSTVSNTNATYDSTASAVTINTPYANSLTNNTNVSYALSKDISAGDIVFTWTGGNEDDSSPHTYRAHRRGDD